MPYLKVVQPIMLSDIDISQYAFIGFGVVGVCLIISIGIACIIKFFKL